MGKKKKKKFKSNLCASEDCDNTSNRVCPVCDAQYCDDCLNHNDYCCIDCGHEIEQPEEELDEYIEPRNLHVAKRTLAIIQYLGDMVHVQKDHPIIVELHDHLDYLKGQYPK